MTRCYHCDMRVSTESVVYRLAYPNNQGGDFMFIWANPKCDKFTEITIGMVIDVAKANPIVQIYNPLGLAGLKAICKLIEVYKEING